MKKGDVKKTERRIRKSSSYYERIENANSRYAGAFATKQTDASMSKSTSCLHLMLITKL